MPRATYAKMAPRSRRALIWSRILVSRALAEEGENVEHRRDVQGGTLWAGTTGSSSRRQERACSSAGVWLARETVRKMLRYAVPPAYRRQQSPKRPKLGPWLGVIDAILEDDKQQPKKQRHTAKRIFERLRSEHAYTGG